MLKNSLDGLTYNSAIVAASNYIGQKLFAYISHGKNINDRIRDKFRKALIFIGDEGQIYQPLTNTYIGIGQTAYTHAITYIEEAHEKIDALNKMLTASMVTSIYANWGKDTWENMTEVADNNGTYSGYAPGVMNDDDIRESYTFEELLPTKVFATNDIILKGIGDYDPQTKLASTYEVAHVIDKNISEEEDPNKLSDFERAQRKALEGSRIILNPTSAFATSGITVSLEKGLNRYMFTYTFTTPDMIPGADNNVWTDWCASQMDKNLNWRKTINVYFTNEDFVSFMESTAPFTVPDYNDPQRPEDPLVIYTAGLRPGDTKCDNPLAAFKRGLVPVWDDGFGTTRNSDGLWEYTKLEHYNNAPDFSNTEGGINDKYLYLSDDLKRGNKKLDGASDDGDLYWYQNRYYQTHQLFKQGKNTLAIDDKLTWSYIASAYSYTLDFSKEYTDTQVERIYRELLGESSVTLIPVGFEQVVVQKPNEDATLDIDHLNIVWDEANSRWDNTIKNLGDTVNDSSSLLNKYQLNRGSLYVKEYKLEDDVNLSSLIINPVGNKTYYPWFVLSRLAKNVEDYMREYKLSIDANPEPVEINGTKYIIALPGETLKFAISVNGANYYAYAETYKEQIDNALKAAPIRWKVDGDTAEYEFDANDLNLTSTDVFAGEPEDHPDDDLNNIFFMGYERDTDYSKVTINGDPLTNEEIADGWKYSDYEREDSPGNNTTLGDKDFKDRDQKNDLGRFDNDVENQPADGKWGIPAGGDWGGGSDYNYPNHNYTGTKYSLSSVYLIIDNIDDIVRDFDQDDRVLGSDWTDTYHNLYVVNTTWTPSTEINIADGIQTLKEVAYVLDIITDGWGKHYEDGEGNGILLTYTIANNHDRIVDHERRLKAIESGKNVVKGIGKLDYLTSNYVDLTVTSDILWRFEYMPESFSISQYEEGSYKIKIPSNTLFNGTDYPKFNPKGNTATFVENLNDDGSIINWSLSAAKTGKNFGLSETTEWLGFVDVAGAYHEEDRKVKFVDMNSSPNQSYCYNVVKIPTSYIIGYNSDMRHYLLHQEWLKTGADVDDSVNIELPSWNKYGIEGVGILECVSDIYQETKESGPNSSYIFASPDNRYLAIHSYVGHVGLGIDLKLAQTYTTIANLHNDTEDQNNIGFICVDVNSPVLIKKVNVFAYLPGYVETNTDITAFGENDNELSSNNINNFQKRYAVDAVTSALDLYGDIYDQETDLGLLFNRLSEMGLVINESGTQNYTDCINEFNVIIDASEHDKARFTFEYVIDPNNATVGEEYTGKLYANDTTIGNENIYPTSLTNETETITENFVISTTKNPELFIRYKANKTITSVDLEYDGLTTTKWVTTYVSNVTSDFNKSLSELEVKSISHAENLIKSLDNNFVAQRDKMVIGVSQKNGIVTPILANIPKDELTSSVVIWGENSKTKRDYRPVTSDEITSEILTDGTQFDGVEDAINKDFPLYIRLDGKVDYVLLNNDEYTTIDTDGNEVPIITLDDFTGESLITNSITLRTEHSKFSDLVKHYDIISDQLYTLVDGKFVTIDSALGSIANKASLVSSSWLAGFKYENYLPIYFATQAYERIDGAKLVRTSDDNNWSYSVDEKIYESTDDVTTTQIFTTKVAKVAAQRKYISTTYEQHSVNDGGNGGTSMHVTAHITKLADATKENSGLVDAYDVRETLDNMFEWVDLSLWDEQTVEGDAKVFSNPINTLSNEQGGYRDDNFNISTANTLGDNVFPRKYYTDEEILEKSELSSEMLEWYKNNPDADRPNNLPNS